jgi:hypothetical protein
MRRQHFFDADRRDIEPGQVDAQIGVAFVGANDDAAGFGHGEIGPGHAGVGREEIRARRLALALREIVDIAVPGIRA